MTDTGAVHTVVSAGSRSAASGVSLTPRLIASDIAEMTLRSLAHTIALGGSDRSRNCVVASSASLWSPATHPMASPKTSVLGYRHTSYDFQALRFDGRSTGPKVPGCRLTSRRRAHKRGHAVHHVLSLIHI